MPFMTIILDLLDILQYLQQVEGKIKSLFAISILYKSEYSGFSSVVFRQS